MKKKLELYITLPLTAHLFLKGNSEIANAMKSKDLQRMKIKCRFAGDYLPNYS